MSSTEAPAPLRVGLASSDLLVRSRVELGLRAAPQGARLEAADEPSGDFDLLLVDLNRWSLRRLLWLERLGAPPRGTDVICFGPHTEMEQLSAATRRLGVSRCVANSHLPAALQSWLRAHAPGPEGEAAG